MGGKIINLIRRVLRVFILMKRIFTRRKLAYFFAFIVAIPLLSFLAFKTECAIVNKRLPVLSELSTSSLQPQIDEEKYSRPEVKTYLTYPEWYIVYSAQEYAGVMRTKKPSDFSYFGETEQFWRTYCHVYGLTKPRYGFSGADHVVLAVIGTSFSVENILKGAYENSVGRLFEFVSTETEEDLYARQVAGDYGNFLPNIPWYEFPFGQKLKGLWTDTPFFGKSFLRKWERKAILTAEYSVKAAYGALIKKATKATYGDQDLEIKMVVAHLPASGLPEGAKLIRPLEGDLSLMSVPRYQKFTEIMPQLAALEIEFLEIAGNDEIFMTMIAPTDWRGNVYESQELFRTKILSEEGRVRISIKVPVTSLSKVLNSLAGQGLVFEHLYDY